MTELTKRAILEQIEKQCLPPERSTPEDDIDLCLAFDRNFIPHAAVTLLSAARVKGPAQKLRVHILHSGDIAPDDRAALENSVPRAAINWHEVSGEHYGHLPDNRDHVSRATYLRLFIPEALHNVASRVIYLDCDTIVVDQLAQLWETDLQGSPIAAAPDEGGVTQAERLGLSENAFYFNAGVLIFDLSALDPAEFAEHVDRIYRENAEILELQDQDILNLMFEEHVHRLHLRWNTNTRLFTPNDFIPGYDVREANEAMAAPGILHFTDRRKPWNANCNHPLRNLYWEIRNKTPWRESLSEKALRHLKNAFRNRFSKSRKAVTIAE